jgi:uncharacterized protein (DUF1499 family)
MTAATGGSAPMMAAHDVIEPCRARPNSVSTLATDAVHGIAPFRYSGSFADARAALLAILNAIPRTTITTNEGNVIRAVFRTRILRYRDDGVFVIDDAAKTIHFRSASRLGRSDWGVNRARMEAIRAQFNA